MKKSDIEIKFSVTKSQKETIDSRALENGFDDTASYVKVVSLKTQPFNLTSAGLSTEDNSIDISFYVTDKQRDILDSKMKESSCEDLSTYLKYVSQHSVVNSVVEVRSTGGLDAMLKRIADSKK